MILKMGEIPFDYEPGGNGRTVASVLGHAAQRRCSRVQSLVEQIWRQTLPGNLGRPGAEHTDHSLKNPACRWLGAQPPIVHADQPRMH